MTRPAASAADYVARPQVVGREWTRRAVCRDHPYLPPSTWDAEVEGDRSRTRRRERLEDARWACLGCPVAEPCLEEHLSGYGGGIRAGYVFPDATDGVETPTRAELSRQRSAA